MGNAGKLIFPPIGCCGYGWYKARVLGLAVFVLGLVGCQRSESGPMSVPAAATFLYPFPLVPANTRHSFSQGTNPFTPFRWEPVAGATGYYLQVGTAPGLQDVFAVGELPPNVTKWPVDNLLPGTYYARLLTQSAAGWAHRDLEFSTLPQPSPLDQSTFYATVEQLTASVRLSANEMNVPVPGTALAAELAERGRTSADCTDYAYTLSGVLQEQNIYSRTVVLTLNGTYWLGHTIVEYYDPFWHKWSVADATFGAVLFDDSTGRGQSAAELNQYVVAESWDLIKPKFVTQNGDSYMTNYYVDPITLYLNLVPQGSTPPQSVTHDPRQILLPFSPGSSNVDGVYTFGFGTNSESLQLNNPPAGMITVGADDSTVWTRAYILNDDWSIASAPADAQVYTFRRVLF
jgi:hypothetical protein